MHIRAKTVIGIALSATYIVPLCTAPIVSILNLALAVIGDVVFAGIKEGAPRSKTKHHRMSRGFKARRYIDPGLNETAKLMNLPPGMSDHDVELCRQANHGEM
ncbi:hypothetical protein BGW36DRAFT_149864 [Talaromyces proteolyticus]|uniref:Uncharacterized protein n=1 Tax=Talaromyces proteolyticus TaxID=1131652 RepID=A0AAD4KWW5_9EURO|nr:uncharacterized protein BGW36DRAFT_149864 [Talaromyces proteolyticus]KAH8698703.1 hypothetical protein BGW36DRAFT_149864 [Talaromyces proteolyticus]